MLFAWLVLGMLCTVAFYVAEARTNPAMHDLFDAVWWGVGSLTTVGSDLFPVTLEGRLAAILLMGIGVFLMHARDIAFGEWARASMLEQPTPGSSDGIELEFGGSVRRQDRAIRVTERKSRRVTAQVVP